MTSFPPRVIAIVILMARALDNRDRIFNQKKRSRRSLAKERYWGRVYERLKPQLRTAQLTGR